MHLAWTVQLDRWACYKKYREFTPSCEATSGSILQTKAHYEVLLLWSPIVASGKKKKWKKKDVCKTDTVWLLRWRLGGVLLCVRPIGKTTLLTIFLLLSKKVLIENSFFHFFLESNTYNAIHTVLGSTMIIEKLLNRCGLASLSLTWRDITL